MKVGGRLYILHHSRVDEFKIWNLSDLHFGSKACAIDNIKKDIETIENDPYSFWFGGGDYADYILPTDKRWDPDTVAEFVKVKDLGKLGKTLTEGVAELFKPIKHKCLGLLFGNHELKYEQWNDAKDLHAWLCNELGVQNLGYSALFDVVFLCNGTKGQPKLVREFTANYNKTHSQKFRFFAHHGAGFATTPAGKLTRLIRFMTYFEANVFMVGHVHDQQGKRIVTIGANEFCNKLKTVDKLGLIAGSYLKTYQENVTTYGEQRGYEPTVLGPAMVKLIPHAAEWRDKMRGEI